METQDFTMISGDSTILEITLTNKTTEELYDLDDIVEAKWGILLDGNLLEKKLTEGEVTVGGIGILNVAINPEDTESYEGKYNHELQLTDVNSNIYTPFKAIVTIVKDIIE